MQGENMTPREEKVYKQTRLRNLKRKYSRLIQHSDLTYEALHVKTEIDSLENELNS